VRAVINAEEALGGKTFACIPPAVTTGQLAKIVLKFAGERPAQLHQRQDWMTIMALGEAFPCEK
jgi:hypothetical protein